jgi:hypothetical protein
MEHNPLNPIDNVFKQGLEGLSLPPPQNVWSGIKNIALEHTVAKLSRQNLWLKGLCVFFFITTLSTLLLWRLHENTEDIHTVSRPLTMVVRDTVYIFSNKNVALTQPIGRYKRIGLKNINSGNISLKNDNNTNANNVLYLSGGSYVSAKTTKYQSFLTSTLPTNTILPIELNTSTILSKPVSDNEKNNTQHNTQLNKIAHKDICFEEMSLPSLSYQIPIDASNTKDVRKKIQLGKIDNPIVGLSMSPEWAHWASAGLPLNAQPLGVSSGSIIQGTFQFDVTNRLKMSIGLGYAWHTPVFDGVKKTLVSPVLSNGKIIYPYYTGLGKVQLEEGALSYKPEMSEKIIIERDESSVAEFRIPIQYSYSFFQKKELQLYALGGVSFHIPVYADFETEIYDARGGDFHHSFTGIQNTRSWYWAGVVGLGLNYELSNKWSFFTEPTFRFSNMSIVQGLDYQTYWNSFGLQTGLKYKLK